MLALTFMAKPHTILHRKHSPSNLLIMQTKEVETYQSPQIVTIETLYEGVVCSSNETLDENYVDW